jgi:mono/diheme cytochrome c family protein
VAHAGPAQGSVPDGAASYERHCSSCHDRGPEHPGTARLVDRYPAQPSLLDRQGIPPIMVRIIVRHGLNLMPAFRPGEISDKELEALGTFLAAGPHPAEGEAH